MSTQEDLKALIQQAASALNIKSDEIILEIQTDSKLGDFSTNFALKAFKSYPEVRTTFKSPLDLANKIKERITTSSETLVEKVEVASPGFINFFINKKSFAEQVIKEILNAKENEFKCPTKPGKVIIEHTSVNPNKSMHIGHLRNAIIGDVLVRLYKHFGYNVETHNYIDDTGLQVADTTNAVLNLGIPNSENKPFDDYCWDLYAEINKLYQNDKALEAKRAEVVEAMDKGEGPIFQKSQEISEQIITRHLSLMKEFGINYDALIYESDVIKKGFWEKTFEQLKKSPHFVLETEGKNEGCWVLKYDSPQFGDKVFVRKNGTLVYTAKDTAYHFWKFGLIKDNFLFRKLFFDNDNEFVWRSSINKGESLPFGNATQVINVVDERQTYPMEMVKHALGTLGYQKECENMRHIAYGVVNISPETAEELGIEVSEDKTSYSMSGRKGIGVKARDLLNLLINKLNSRDGSLGIESSKAVATAALRHYMLKHNPATLIVFDYDQALQTKGNTGPYLQYSYARAVNILNKIENTSKISEISKDVQLSDSENELVKLLSEYKEVLEKSLETGLISYLSEYAFRLASGFHIFYENNNVIKAPEHEKQFRIMLINCYIDVLGLLFHIMGITPLNEM